MRLATFNILHGQSVTGPMSSPDAHLQSTTLGPETATELEAAIRTLDADVVAIQEADVNQPRSGHTNQPEAVARAMAAVDSCFVPTVIGTPGGAEGFRSSTAEERDTAADGNGHGRRYGVALASRYPVVAWRREVFEPAPLSLPLLVQLDGRPKMLKVPDEQRAAIAATIEAPWGLFTVATAHLSFVPGYNVKQLRQIRRWLTGLPRPLVLMGDFNLPSPIPARITRWDSVLRAPSFPAYRPRVQFDHILVDGISPDALERMRAGAQAVALPISDHCAITARLEL
ncbi:MAG: endonuclease/exonuclease/phosphatase family protein [Candidatus Nanopelagicales bacterium]